MSAKACEDPDLPDPAFRLYAVMCARADPAHICRFCLKAYAGRRNKSVRAVQESKKKLEELGWIEELHEGDKTYGTFRVIRHPDERGPVRIKNAVKIADRAARKTTYANRASHPRCESGCAQIKNKNQESYMAKTQESILVSETDSNISARQATQKGERSVTETPSSKTVQPVNDTSRNLGIDWNGWAAWFASSRRIAFNDALYWIMTETDCIAEERGVNKAEAERILEQRLKAERRMGK